MMQFYIKVTDKKRRRSIGEIKLGDFQETFDMSMSYWTVADYEAQWLNSLRRVLSGKDSSLITSMVNPASANYIVWWPMYVRGANIVVHNQLLFLDQLKEDFCIDHPYVHVPAYSDRNEDGEKISEWVTSKSSVEFFLRSEANFRDL